MSEKPGDTPAHPSAAAVPAGSITPPTAASEQRPAPKPEEEVTLNGVRLVLQNCTVSFSSASRNGRFDLGLPDGCRFARDEKSDIHVVKTKAGPTVLVESSRPVPPSYPGSKDCDTRLRAVIVRDAGAVPSAETQRVASCGPGKWDELMFHALSAQRVE